MIVVSFKLCARVGIFKTLVAPIRSMLKVDIDVIHVSPPEHIFVARLSTSG